VSKLTPLPPRIVAKFLNEHGFRLDRIRGSHHMYVHPDGRHTIVPVHGNEDISVGILSSILKSTDMTRDELIDWLRR
jgi:predicted RNA binding protein YcfA (HicA-like mRNA interferase family)